MTVAHTLIQKGRWMYIFGYLIAPLGYLIKLLVSQSISVETFGILYTLIGLCGLISVYNDVGCTEALQYFFPKLSEPNDHNKRLSLIIISLCIQLGTSLLLIGGLFFWTEEIISHFISRYSCLLIHPQIVASIHLFGLFILFTNVSQVTNSVLLAMHETFWQQFLGRIRLVITLIGTLILRSPFFSSALTLQTFVRVRLGGYIISVLIGGVILGTEYRSIFVWKKNIDGRNWELVQEFLRYAITSLFGLNAGAILGQIDQQMVMYFLGPLSAGYMTTYLSVVQIPMLIVLPIIGFIYPLVSTLRHQQKTDDLLSLLRIMSTYGWTIGCALAALLSILAYPIVIGLFGDDYLFVVQLMKWGIRIAPFLIMQSIMMAILGGMGRIKQRNIILSGAVIIALVLNRVLITPFGILGVISATIATSICMVIASTAVIYRTVPFSFDRKFFLKNMGVVIILALASKWGYTMIAIESMGRLSLIFLCVGLCIIRAGGFYVSNISVLKPIIASIRSHKDDKQKK